MKLSTLSVIREQPRQAQALFCSVFLFRCGTMAFPFYGAYLVSRDIATVADAALVIAAFGIGALTADLAASAVLPRVRADLVIKAAIAVLAGLMLGIGSVSSFLPLLGLTFVWGLCYEAVTPASYAVIADVYHGRNNKMAFACNRLAINMGMAIGPLIGGLLYAYAPPSIFLGNAAAFAFTALFVATRLTAGDARPSRTGHGGPAAEAALSADGKDRRFWFAFLVAVPLHLAFALPPTMIGVLVIESLGRSAVWVSAIFALNTLMVIALEVPLNHRLADRRTSTVLLVAFALSGAGFMAMGLTGRPALLLCATALWTFGEMTIFPTLLAYIDRISPRRLVKRNMGLYSAGVNVGILVAPPAALALTRVSGGLPWVLAGGALIASAGALLLARDARRLWSDAPSAEAQGEARIAEAPASG